MFAEEEQDKAQQPPEEGEAPETMRMSGEETPKPEEPPKPPRKKAGDWVTAQMSKVTGQKPPEQPPGPKPGGEWSEGAPSAPPGATPVAGGTPAAPAGQAGGGIWGFLEGLGIKGRQTQQWVLIGTGIVLFLCCACACIIGGYLAWTNL